MGSIACLLSSRLNIVAATAGEDPHELWEEVIVGLERLGAEIESDRPGRAWFAIDPLLPIAGGTTEAVLDRAGGAVGVPSLLAAAPGRFCAYAAAMQQEAQGAGERRGRRRPLVVDSGKARSFLAPITVGLLDVTTETATLPPLLERLGVRTLGRLAGLPRDAVADRFGAPGLLAHDLAAGRDLTLRPRRPRESLVERIELPEAATGAQLEHALRLLVDRLLARPERRGRALRALALGARLVGEGTWRAEVPLREASADPERLWIVLSSKIAGLPSPALRLSLQAVGLGAPAVEQEPLSGESAEARRRRLDEAARQARSVAGRDAVLRVIEVDPGSRLPERRLLLTPYA